MADEGGGGVQAMGHLLLVCEEKAFCQLGAPSPPMGVTAHSPGHTKPLGPEKVPPMRVSLTTHSPTFQVIKEPFCV